MSEEQEPIVDTLDKGWKASARKLMAQKKQFAVVNVTEATLEDCIELSQEFDFFLVQEFGEERRFPRLASRFSFVPKSL